MSSGQYADDANIAEPHELLGRNLLVGARLWTASQVFFFVCFLFAFFYLRELDENHMWHPRGVTPPTGWGSAILACIVAAAVAYALSMRLLRGRSERAWRSVAAGSLLLGLAGVGLQCVEWTTLGFGPTQGSYASVFLAWTGFYTITLLGGCYWLETLVAHSLRSHLHHEKTEVDHPPGLVIPSAEAFGVYWYFLAGVQVVLYILLYFVH